jgi:hypothetical protein
LVADQLSAVPFAALIRTSSSVGKKVNEPFDTQFAVKSTHH